MTADKKRIQFSKHALDPMIDRGASEDEIRLSILDGEEIPAAKGKESV